MPNIIVRVPEGAFDAAGRKRLGQGLTAAAKAVERIGDDPRQEFTTWVLIDEIKPGCFFAGWSDPLARVLPVIVFFHVPAGVLDAAGRTDAARRVQAAVEAAKAETDPRPVMTSVLIADVPDGTWGVNGGLWHLPDFVRASGYRHLQPAA